MTQPNKNLGGVEMEKFYNKPSRHTGSGEFDFYDNLENAVTDYNANGGTVMIPDGTWSYSTTIQNGSDGTGFVGMGKGTTILDFTGTGRPFDFQGNHSRYGGFTVDMANADSGAPSARFYGGIYCYVYPVEVRNAPNDGITVYGEQGFGMYYCNYEFLDGSGSSGRGVVFRSPSGDDRRIQANFFQYVLAIHCGSNAVEVENTQNGNLWGVIDAENATGTRVIYNGGDGAIMNLYADSDTSDGSVHAFDASGASGNVAVANSHIEGGGTEVTGVGNISGLSGDTAFLNTQQVSLNTTDSVSSLGYDRAGWSQQLVTWNNPWTFRNRQDGIDVVTISDNNGEMNFPQITGPPLIAGRGIGVPDKTQDPVSPSNGARFYYRSDLSPPELRAVGANGTTVTIAQF